MLVPRLRTSLATDNIPYIKVIDPNYHALLILTYIRDYYNFFKRAINNSSAESLDSD